MGSAGLSGSKKRALEGGKKGVVHMWYVFVLINMIILTCRGDGGQFGTTGTFVGQSHTTAVVITEKLIHGIATDVDKGFDVAIALLWLHVMLHPGRADHFRVALEGTRGWVIILAPNLSSYLKVNIQGLSHSTMQLNRSILDHERVLWLLQKDRQLRLSQILGGVDGQMAGPEG